MEGDASFRQLQLGVVQKKAVVDKLSVGSHPEVAEFQLGVLRNEVPLESYWHVPHPELKPVAGCLSPPCSRTRDQYRSRGAVS